MSATVSARMRCDVRVAAGQRRGDAATMAIKTARLTAVSGYQAQRALGGRRSLAGA